MPQITQRLRERDGICQDCLEREMGNWFEEEVGEEVARMANHLFSNLDVKGNCVICGNHIAPDQDFGMYDMYPSMMFDCVSERLEIEDYRERWLDTEEEYTILN